MRINLRLRPDGVESKRREFHQLAQLNMIDNCGHHAEKEKELS